MKGKCFLFGAIFLAQFKYNQSIYDIALSIDSRFFLKDIFFCRGSIHDLFLDRMKDEVVKLSVSCFRVDLRKGLWLVWGLQTVCGDGSSAFAFGLRRPVPGPFGARRWNPD